MSIRIQCCGLVIISILLFFLGRQRKTHLITERVFRWVIWSAFFCVLLDVSSILVINRFYPPASLFIQFFMDLICKLYLVTLPIIGVCTLLYLCTDIYYDQPEQLKKRANIYGTICFAGMMVIFALPIVYHQDETGQVTNTDGPSVYATYVLITLCLGLLVFQLIKNRRRLNHRRRSAVIVWMALWIGSFIVQLHDNSMLLAGFACSTGILIIYLSLENPESNYDKQTGLFSHSVLVTYLKQVYSQKQDFSALLLLFETLSDRRMSRQTAEDFKLNLGRYLENHSQWMAFRQSDNKVFFIFDSVQQAQEVQAQIAQHIAQLWPDPGMMPVTLHWMLVPSARDIAATSDELLYLMQYISRKHYFDEDLLVADEKLVGEVRQDRKIEALLDSAIVNDSIEVFYQPIYSTRERRITCAEALVRIRDEEGKLVPPGLFIPIAEANGMILPLGKLIFDHVCRFIKKHPLDDLGLSYIEVNLSVVQCASNALATDYIDIMRRYAISPQHINLEITESASTAEKKILLKNMDQLIDFGTSFSLDDFGTGQSNLDYIMDMPVKLAKFDRSMTQAYFSNQRAKHVMTAAIHMIHDMGLKIVSEGVETVEELRVIEELGIEYIQGFYFSKPLPEDEFLEYIQNFLPPEPLANPA